MIVEHKTTGKQYQMTPEAWAKIKARGKSDTYRIVEAPEPPKEIKKLSAARKDKPAETDHNGLTSIDDRLPGEDAGER